MPNPPGKCIFCGQGGMSKEHVFGVWLRELFPRTPDAQHTFGTVAPSMIVGIPRITTNDRQGHTGTVFVRVVCDSCNNGWLSALEKREKPILTPMILGEKCRLSPEDQNILSVWAAKTAMTAEYKQRREDGTTQEERTFLMERERPPSNWFVWVATYEGSGWRDLTLSQHRGNLQKTPIRRPGTSLHYIQATIFGMGRVVFRVIGTTCPEGDLRFGRMNDEALVKIWPTVPRSALWPPYSILADHQVNEAADILNRTFDNSLNPLASWAFAP
jgi:hypothetical protein